MTATTIGHHYADLAREVVGGMNALDLPNGAVAFAVYAASHADAMIGNMATDDMLRAAMIKALEDAAAEDVSCTTFHLERG